MNEIEEIRTNIISEGTRIEGQLHLDHISRVHGTVHGDVTARQGSTVILGETAVIEGNIQADVIVIDGFVRGSIEATGRVVISSTGRVIGNVKSNSFKIEFGGYFEGRCLMEENSTLTGSA